MQRRLQERTSKSSDSSLELHKERKNNFQKNSHQCRQPRPLRPSERRSQRFLRAIWPLLNTSLSFKDKKMVSWRITRLPLWTYSTRATELRDLIWMKLWESSMKLNFRWLRSLSRPLREKCKRSKRGLSTTNFKINKRRQSKSSLSLVLGASNKRSKPKWTRRNSNNNKSLKGNSSKNNWMRLQLKTFWMMLSKGLKPRLALRQRKSLSSLTRNSKKLSRPQMQKPIKSLRSRQSKLNKLRPNLNRSLIPTITPQMLKFKLELQPLQRWTRRLTLYLKILLLPRPGSNLEQPSFYTMTKQRRKSTILPMKI